ncbi:MAG: hypothetical protein ABI967_16185 [bacterium]
MPRYTKRKSRNEVGLPSPGSGEKGRKSRLFDQSNRGLLLDLVVFIANLFLLRMLTRSYLNVFQAVSAEDPTAKLILSVTALAMWLLPAAGAVLKRWHFHQRRKAQGKTVQSQETKLAGCLFNPLFYFCLNLVITSVVITGFGDLVFGKTLMNNGALFTATIVAGLISTMIQTYLIYRYFSQPKNPPKSRFLRSPDSELLGDICLFFNMILFQVAWNLLTFADLGHPSNVLDVAGRLFFLSFVALLIYFPPRMLYLAEDINRPRTWLTMLLANSPVIVRVLIGTGSNSTSTW